MVMMTAMDHLMGTEPGTAAVKSSKERCKASTVIDTVLCQAASFFL
jgi:hypothetical protein